MIRFGATSTVLRPEGSRKGARFFCMPAWAWLVIIVFTEAILMAGWLVQEYYYFDYTCLLLSQNRSNVISDHSTAFGPRLVYASADRDHRPQKRTLRRFLEFNSSGAAPMPEVLGEEAADADLPHLITTSQEEGASVLVLDEPLLLTADLEQFGSRARRSVPETPSVQVLEPRPRRLRKKPRSKLQQQTPPHTTVESVVLIEQLPMTDGGDSRHAPSLRIKTTRIKHVPRNESMEAVRKRKRKKSKGNSGEEPIAWAAPRRPGKRYHSLEEEAEVRPRNAYKPKSGRRAGARAKGTKRQDRVLGTPISAHATTIPTTTTTTTTTTGATEAAVVTAIGENETTNVFAGALEKGLEAGFAKSEESSTTTETPLTTAHALPSETPSPSTVSISSDSASAEAEAIRSETHEDSQQTVDRAAVVFDAPARPRNFQVQLDSFVSIAVCISRSLLDLWCAAQLVASVPFLLGVCLKTRCLFIMRLMLDALFVVILFILTITVIAFSVILYALVDEMQSEEALKWVAFGLVLFGVVLLYTLAFTATLRCCELVLNERPQPYKERRSKSLLYTEIGSEQLLEAADEL